MIVGVDTKRVAELEEDNRRLRRLLDQRDAPGELRHRLRSTLALLLAIVRRSSTVRRDRADYAAHLEDRLDAIIRAQALADQHGEVDLQILLAEEFLKYGALEGGPVRLSGPKILLQPRFGQVLALAIHELAINAVEHGALGVQDGQIEVVWDFTGSDNETTLTLQWSERGEPACDEPSRRGFGTEVLTRMLSYEFKADVRIAFEPGGLECTMRFPSARHLGRVDLGTLDGKQSPISRGIWTDS